ncbi:MAG: CHRD domain-containing protein [Acidimicrobiia bacterium]|nr:CHRD domain-containing protein [Acidimicrobiia bacterium]
MSAARAVTRAGRAVYRGGWRTSLTTGDKGEGIIRKLVIASVLAATMIIPAAAGADPPDEIGFVDPATGFWQLGADESFYFGVPGDIPFLGDWDGDGVDTPGLYRPTEGYAYIINRREIGFADASWFMGNPGDIPIVGDWDGDGDDTFSVYRPSEGKVYINNFNQTRFAQEEYYFGVPSDKPFAIDFNGDGRDDVGLHRESTGLVYMTDAITDGVPDGTVAATDLEFYWGIADDAVFAGDWNATGVEAPGLVRPTASRTFLRFTNSLGFADEDWPTEFGDWSPVVGRIPGAPYRFAVELSSSEVVPGPGLPGGSGAVDLSVTAGGEVCFSLEFNGVSGVTAAHVHEGAAGAVGPPVVDLGLSGGDAFGCVSTATEAAVGILDRPEDYYVQVHTGSHPDGALRGQIATSRAWDLGLVGAQVVGLGDADGFVPLSLTVSTSGRVCTTSYTAERIDSAIGIGLYAAAEGLTGPLVADVTFGSTHTGCATVVPRSAAAMVLANPPGYYLQVATAQFPDGAVRAQLSATN